MEANTFWRPSFTRKLSPLSASTIHQRRVKETNIDVEEALRNHDSYRALERVGALLKTGPTGTNVNSMVIAVVGESTAGAFGNADTHQRPGQR
ncbi:MOFRL family protein [Thermococcus sp.]|uniref:MOFRL family protein n=1 Tax=Thermococcus sp. TaxID=35749 RepID=UPI003182C9BE